MEIDSFSGKRTLGYETGVEIQFRTAFGFILCMMIEFRQTHLFVYDEWCRNQKLPPNDDAAGNKREDV